MEVEISKIDAAVDQLDWAIRLFLDHRAYVPAITLAGAAEEILGKAVGAEAAFETLKKQFTLECSMPEMEVSHDHLNKARNWLKHWDRGTDAKTECMELNKEALQYITRALANLATHDRWQQSEGPRFARWISENGLWPDNS